mgnify:CR=1 FL=1
MDKKDWDPLIAIPVFFSLARPQGLLINKSLSKKRAANILTVP